MLVGKGDFVRVYAFPVGIHNTRVDFQTCEEEGIQKGKVRLEFLVWAVQGPVPKRLAFDTGSNVLTQEVVELIFAVMHCIEEVSKRLRLH